MRMAVDGYLAFVHGFEQGRLRLGRGAVDLIGQQHIGEHRARLKLELLLHRGVHRNSKHIGRQHVAGELETLERAIQRAGQSMGQRGLAHSWNTFNEQVPARQHGDQSEPDHLIIAANDLAKRLFQRRSA